MDLIYILRTFLVFVYMVLFAVLIAPPFILYAALSGSAEFLYRVGRAGVSSSMRLAGIRPRVEGIENIPPGVCVFVANHASNLDPPIMMAVIPRRIGLLAKAGLFRIPIISIAMRLAGFVPIERTSPRAAAAALASAVVNLRTGIPYVVFPEGTRSLDGRLATFKKGSFVMAIQAAVPVVPVSISGTQKLMGRGHWFVRPGEPVIRFGEPVNPGHSTADQRNDLLLKAYERIADGLPKNQKPIQPVHS